MSTSELLRGLALFDKGEYFAAHEVLEDIWRAAPRNEKKAWQGLVQLAVAFHHHKTGNIAGAHSVMSKAFVNLSTPRFALAPAGKLLLPKIGQWLKYLEQGGEVPPVPQLASTTTLALQKAEYSVSSCKED